MDCEQFEALLPDLDRPGSPAAASRMDALAHAEACSHCAALLCESEALDFALGTLAHDDAGINAPPRLEAALIQRFRREKEIAGHRGVRRRVASFAAVAAIVLLALGIALRHRARLPENSAQPPQSASTVAAIVPEKTTPSASPVSPAAAQEVQRHDASRHDALPSTEESDDYTSSFVPLPYADDASDLQDGAVVQVILPRSALASFGLPATVYAGYADRVPADLILSEDGTPEAIRLVSQTAAQRDF